MPLYALALVLLAAFCHATWNLFLKKSQGGGTLFFWLAGSIEVLLYAPLAIAMIITTGYRPDALALGMMAGSAAIHVGYFIFLDRGYRSGDLSVVYPLARASGPLLTIVAAVLLIGERPAPLALVGALLIGVGAVLLSGNPLRLLRTRAQGALFALSTGAIIAIYTVWDRQAVVALLVPPVIYYWGSIIMRVIMTSPAALRDRPMLRVIWARDKKAVLAVGILSPLAYGLTLYAMKMAPLSYVAPAREMSILIAALYGTHLLKEGDTVRRLAAAALMMLGLAGISLAG
ncbi:MAG TPA: EamA family transporter [Burkholderiales bacterium]|jgi:drug/metabolite transporter (DMT)-like permease|nr:EamA family transporter [Burkholderiales bacterium]